MDDNVTNLGKDRNDDLLGSVTGEINKARRDAAKAEIKKFATQIAEAEKNIRLWKLEIAKIEEDYKAGLR